MATPATAASSGSWPAFINSMALVTAARPLALETATGRRAPTSRGGEAPKAVAPRLAAVAVRNCRRFRLSGMLRVLLGSRWRGGASRITEPDLAANRTTPGVPASPGGILQQDHVDVVVGV